ncbi:hypothetical protein HY837_05740 [archaeon]|nr:hypothetical protein [archaeon]
MENIGKWSFILGILLALVFGLLPQTFAYQFYINWTLVILGLVVAILNIRPEESMFFLIAVIAIILVTDVLSKVPSLGQPLQQAFENTKVFVSPAGLLVALKLVWDLARSK